MDKLTVGKIRHRGWDDCCKVKNGNLELIVPQAVGLRVSSLSFTGDHNIFYEESQFNGISGGDKWHNFGGHRLWHGPQLGDRPAEPDNTPIQAEATQDCLVLIQPTEKIARIEKRMELRLDGNKVVVDHFLTNRNVWETRLTVWAVTALAPGGIGLLPLSRRDTGNMPNYALTFWPWTKPNDRRVHYEADYLHVHHDRNNHTRWKLGYGNDRGWMAYVLGDTLFICRFLMDSAQQYSDYGASCESFACADFFELESLSPLLHLEPGQTAFHRETWSLHHIAPLRMQT